MKTNNFFEKQQPKLRLEAILKSVLCSLAIGFGATFIAALATWFAPINGLWISLGTFIGVTLVAFPLFYFKRFRTTDMQNARRIDRLGLEERLVTMVEFEDNQSVIADLQRRDAQAALATVDNKQLKIGVSTAIIVSLIICTLLGVGMTVVNALSQYGMIPGGDEIWNNFVEEKLAEYVNIYYEIDEGGTLDGDEDQLIIKGTNASSVTAVADDGYVFKAWSDGSTDPTRFDMNVTEDAVYTAIFTELGEDGEGDGDGDGEGEGEGDDSQDAPSDSQENNGSNSNDPGNPNNNAGTGAGGSYLPNNQIINGETYYREVLEYYQDAADDRIQSEDSELSEIEKEMIKKYLGIV